MKRKLLLVFIIVLGLSISLYTQEIQNVESNQNVQVTDQETVSDSTNDNKAPMTTKQEQQTNEVINEAPAVVVPETSLSFSVFGNTRTYLDVYSRIITRILELSPDFVVNTGNCVNTYNNDNEWLKFKKASKPLFSSTKYYALPGKLDFLSSDFYKIFNLQKTKAYISIPQNDVLFIFLDSNMLKKEDDEQYEWIKKTLEDSSTSKFKILFIHSPLYSSGESGGFKQMQTLIRPLIDTYRIDVVFSGQEASYERLSISNTHYIVTGGAGAPLTGEGVKLDKSVIFKRENHFCHVKIKGKELAFTAEGIDGSVLDSFTLTK